jgi:tetratricopeptide (TPR) repeat protein
VFAVSGLAAGLILTGAAWTWNRRQGEEKKTFLPESLFFLALAMIGVVLTFLFATWLAYQEFLFPVPGTSTHFPDWLGVVSFAENRRMEELVGPLRAKNQVFTLIARYIYFIAAQGGPIISYSVGSFPLLNFFLFTLLGVSLWLAAIARYGRRLPARKPEWSLAILFAPILLAVMFSQVKDRTGQWGWELALWRSTIRENPNSFTGWNNLGRAYVTRDRLPEAVSCFISAHALEPYRLDPILNLGNTMLKLNDLAAAEHYYRWALKLNPFSFIAQLNLGNCLAAKKDYQDAVSIYLEALQVQPDSFEATYNLAWCFYQLGDRGRAWIYLQKTLQLAPHHRPSLMLLEQLKQSP